MQLMAIDQSVRGFAIAAAPTFWAGDWNRVATARFDGGAVKRKDERGNIQRLRRLLCWFEMQICEHNPNIVGFESYGFGSGADYSVVELVGACKHRLLCLQKEIETVQMSTARKFIADTHGRKVPRKGNEAKALMKNILVDEHESNYDRTLDETDALVLLNAMLVAHGGLPLVA